MFAAWFRERLQQQGLTYAAFAARVHVSKPVVAFVATARRGPPLDRLGAWLDALGVTPGAERDRLVLLGLLASADHDLQRAWQQLETELSSLRTELRDARRLLAARPARRASRPPARAARPAVAPQRTRKRS